MPTSLLYGVLRIEYGVDRFLMLFQIMVPLIYVTRARLTLAYSSFQGCKNTSCIPPLPPPRFNWILMSNRLKTPP